MKDFEGRTAFITGGASGIGLAMARRFAAEGMRIVVADVEEAVLDAAVEDLKGRNADVLGICLDVRDRDAWARAAEQVAGTFGPVHVLCNNAGVGAGGPVQEQSFKDWDWTLGVNLDGVVNGLQTFVAKMVEQGEPAHVVNTASMAGVFGAPGMSIYCGSKFAVVGISESMAADLVDTPVNVSVLCPGFVRTNIFESQRNRPDELRNDTPAERTEEQERMLSGILDIAIPPEHVAECVLDAIREERFWIFTHPEFEEAMRARAENMLAAFGQGPKLAG
ncbi:MAG: SDR family NAD(P)-dependent oxidoreductase [Pseudomonadales bacterium]|jgi:NAD(P)-dependent dehydrogenase (short-subunit alcohol dehydrogenase family)|nr:SDR family NAD(P)-dependent oxidoreductase [Pseudomonadales bacterium]